MGAPLFTSSRPRVLRYVVSILAIAAAIILRLALNPFWGDKKPFLLFFPAIMIAAWFGGFGPGALATAVSVVAVECLWIERPHGAVLPTAADAAALVVFLASGLVIAVLNESFHRARAKEKAARAEEARLRHIQEEMMAIVAHDLRTPLNAIAMNAASVSRQHGVRDDGAIAQRLGLVARAVKRMDGLIGDLLDASRLAEGQFSVEMKVEPIEAIASEAFEAVSTAAAEKGIALHLDLPDVSVLCDRRRIQQVLVNLLGNAVRFTRRGGRIVVNAECDDDSIVIHVEDSGAGISPDHIAHLFDRFWRGDNAGAGLGLYIARGVVEAHGGSICVDSVLGQGTSFKIKLPGPVTLAERGPNSPATEPTRPKLLESQK